MDALLIWMQSVTITSAAQGAEWRYSEVQFYNFYTLLSLN